MPYLTLDIDWAHDDILADTIELIEAYRAPATWFVTHDTPLLSRLRDNPSFELGIHPNFNFLLSGEPLGRGAEEVVERLLAIVPEAKSVRSHSLTQSSGLLDLFWRRGLTHECNSFIPALSGIELKPWSLWNGLCRVPYNWEDDVHFLYEKNGLPEKAPRELVEDPTGGVKIFDFHPIHVFLNTERMDRYESTRKFHDNPKELIKYRHKGYGTRDRLVELLEWFETLWIHRVVEL